MKKINATGALTGLIAGTVCGAIVSFTGTGGIQALATTTATSTGVSLIICLFVSYLTRRAAGEETRMNKFFNRISMPEEE